MATRFLTRSKALALALSRAGEATPAPLSGARWLRTLSSLPRDPAASAPSLRPPAVGSPSGLSKILGFEQTSRLSGTLVLPRWFSTGPSNGSSIQEVQTCPKTIAGMVQSDALKTQEGSSAKITAFSPLEATIGKHRSSPYKRKLESEAV